MSTESEKNIFSKALIDVKVIKEKLKAKVEQDLIKENEAKIDKIVSEILIKEDDENQEENVPTETNDDTESEKSKNTDFIDTLLNDISTDDILKNSDVEIEITTKNDENPESELSSEPKDTEELDIEDDNELEEYYNLTENKLKTESNMKPTKFTPPVTKGGLKEEDAVKPVTKFTPDATKGGLKEDETMNTGDTDATMKEDEIKDTLSEVNKELGDEKPSDTTNTSVSPADAQDWSGLDEEDIKEIGEMTNEQLMEMLKEFDVDGDDSENKAPVASTEEKGDDDLEEGMSVASQTHKSVGGENFPHREGKPERRSNMSEEFKKEIQAIEDKLNVLANENKILKESNEKLKNINNDGVKRLEEIKKKLYEATLMSHKTASVNQLFLECTLNQSEKQQILNEFAEVSTIEQAKNSLSKLKEDFSKKKVIHESIEAKITKTVVQSGTVTLNENKVFSDLNPYKEKFNMLLNYDTKKR